MVERRAQSPDVDKLLVKLEAAIRKGVPLDIPKAAISLFEKYEKLSSRLQNSDRFGAAQEHPS